MDYRAGTNSDVLLADIVNKLREARSRMREVDLDHEDAQLIDGLIGTAVLAINDLRQRGEAGRFH